jgi:hypothetical protein
MPVHT